MIAVVLAEEADLLSWLRKKYRLKSMRDGRKNLLNFRILAKDI